MGKRLWKIEQWELKFERILTLSIIYTNEMNTENKQLVIPASGLEELESQIIITTTKLKRRETSNCAGTLSIRRFEATFLYKELFTHLFRSVSKERDLLVRGKP